LNETDRGYLERAFELAELARGATNPNPLVGAVIVAGGRIIGEGYHAAAGREHAEIAAIHAVSDAALLRGATIYVSLEPCCSFGRTPPCVPAIVSSGFSRVVVGATDPSLQVNGRGLELLKQAGLDVDVADGDLELRFKRQNNGFRKHVATGLPFVTYKYAMTLDGRVAADSGDSKWISSAESRLEVHRTRSWMDAVMVGSGTLQVDDPMLTSRGVECVRQPLRVLIDSKLTLKPDAALVRTADEGLVLAVCAEDVPAERRVEVESWGVETLAVSADDSNGRPAPSMVARMLADRGVQNLLLEGGPGLAGAWWSHDQIDKVVAFVSPRLISGECLWSPLRGVGAAQVAASTQLHEVEVRGFGNDVCISGYLRGAY
jgi:diaminohydroxyphosphoribosylaminopyrimidine deaminase/5-amino-6-(5-phosphoribosylamino)uracil reductase